MTLRAGIYARLSSAQTDKGDDEQSDSIENQLEDLRKTATASGYLLVDEYADDGISGYSGKFRPAFQRLLLDLADGKLDVILTRHQDRLERNEEEGYQVRVASVKAGAKWHFSSGMILNPSTAEGGLLAKVLSAIAEYESAIKTARLSMHYEGLRQSGDLHQPDTFGYNGPELVEAEAERIRQAYKIIAEGGSVRSIYKAWNREGVPQRRAGKLGWTNAHIRAILLRPRNAGLVVDRDGEIIEGLAGNWEKIVERDLWETVTRTLKGNTSLSAKSGRAPKHLGAGISVCGLCGYAMRANTATDRKNGTRYSILRCANPHRAKGQRHPSARTADINALIEKEVLNAFAFGPANLFNLDAPNVDVLSLQRELDGYRQKRAKILDLYEEDAITKSEYLLRVKKFDEPMKVAQEKLDAAVSASASAHMLVDLRAGFIDPESHTASLTGLEELLDELRSRWDELEVVQKKRLADKLLDIRVGLGKGARKYEIRHKVVASLNKEE